MEITAHAHVLFRLLISVSYVGLPVTPAPLALQSAGGLMSDQGLDSASIPSRGLDGIMGGTASLTSLDNRELVAKGSPLGLQGSPETFPSLDRAGSSLPTLEGSLSGHHSRRHGHRGSRGDLAPGPDQRRVYMDCQPVPPTRLRHLLGPAFNARYMSIERPEGLRPQAFFGEGVPASHFGKGYKKGAGMMGDAPRTDSDAGAGAAKREKDTKKSSKHKEQLKRSSLPDKEGEEIVRILDVDDDLKKIPKEHDVIAIPVKEPKKKSDGLFSAVSLSSKREEIALGDQPLRPASVVIGIDRGHGNRPDFAVLEHFRQDLPEEVNAVGDIDDIIQDEYSGLLIFLRRLSAKRDSKRPALGAAPQSTEFLQRKKRAALSSNTPADEPWQCRSELVWEDLGSDHYPRYIRRARCVQNRCYNDFYECREKAFTVKVLRRVGDRCTPVYSATLTEDGTGGKGFTRKLLRYEQEWIFEERALSFCCECTRRFL